MAARMRLSDRTKQKARRAKSGHKEKYRAWSVMKKYGITIEQIEVMLLKQNGCAICHSEHPGWNKGWNVDHDHQDGRVRGILCQPCNLMIGLSKDRTDTLAKAIEYLERSKTTGNLCTQVHAEGQGGPDPA
ncbi:endonuclease VII domain-containing protein [Roseococcus sp. XZZS9]|uniref:Endonuclease VII domain-containing protein n=1 Tax=Roseococcus pinisoli TaxID=2835040 RepID=A0ABS5QF33_9PROT|nr:endonuclease VII domain-containing protein [Roseococcus pinisoli]